MKIGILTLPLHTNYGGILQAYALQSYLKSKGHNVWLIDIANKQSYLKKLSKQLLKSFVGKSDVVIDYGINKFIEKYISPQTEYINIKESTHRLNDYKFDAYIVGSDQVWREEYCRLNAKRYFLDFITDNKVKRIAYAASFGVDFWTYSDELTRELSGLANKFNQISVRESSAVKLCQDNLEVNTKVLVDPTMLLDVDNYIKLSQNGRSYKEELLTYILDINKEKKEIVNIVSKKLSYKYFSINVKEVKLLYLQFKKYPSIKDWIKGFYNAKFVITDSFHGCVFSIIFNKPFIAIGNESRGLTRFKSLLTMFDLENRLILNKSQLTGQLIDNPIDWKAVNKKLQTEQKKVDYFFKVDSAI